MRGSILLWMCLAVCAPGASVAAGVETLLMPGKVIEGHAQHEGDCGKCHDRSNRTPQRLLCLACHEDVAADLAAARGFHGRLKSAASAECRACHSEHQGRNADIVKLGRAAFDHARTDFPLDGLHASADCSGCHKQGAKFRDAPERCIDCHRERDPHGGRLGEDCASCHSSTAWLELRFDHSRTQFPLTAAHREAACGACHVSGRFRDTPRECVACHAADDVHRGARGAACRNCHEVDRWNSARFDHARETGFELSGAHAGVECSACHRSGDYQASIPKTCHGCHRADDAHATRFGERCERCHSSEQWRPAQFDHVRDAHFALTGPHAELACHRCHTAEAGTQKLGEDCGGCHASDNVHGDGFAACESCHGGDAWRPAVRFDHDLSAFPLLGIHVAVPCAGCHSTHAFKEASQDCNACHAKDDVHRGALGAQCANCHNANGWRLWEFDHASTRFALDGAHAAAQCGQCHREPAGRAAPPTDCLSCHRADDVHAGQFGRQCQQCHTTATFRGARRR